MYNCWREEGWDGSPDASVKCSDARQKIPCLWEVLNDAFTRKDIMELVETCWCKHQNIFIVYDPKLWIPIIWPIIMT